MLVSTGCLSKGDSSGGDAPTCKALSKDSDELRYPRVALTDPNGWEKQAAFQDPLADHRPADLHCGLSAYFVETGYLEVDTMACPYVSVQQGSLHAIHAGDPVEIEVFHYDLTSPEPAQGHVAILFGDDLQWERYIDIPQPANVIDDCFTATRDLKPGEPIVFHLHNHGQNTWALTYLRMAATDDSADASTP